MDRQDLDKFEKALTLQIEELFRHAEETASGIRHNDQHYIDPLDQATFDEAQGRLLRLRDRESRLIKKISLALERIKEGTFGICDTCGEDIGHKRLIARPVTTKCIHCKIQEEAMEKAVGF
jgi:RNA polymerase-binding transcription factor